MFSVNEANNKALKINRLQSTDPPFRHSMPIEKSTSDVRVQPSFTMIDRQSTNALASAQAITTAAAAKSKENPYAKPGVGKNYRCGELGHKSNGCPKSMSI